MKIKFKYCLIVFVVLFSTNLFAQISITSVGSGTTNAEQMLEHLIGQGVSVANVQFIGTATSTTVSNHGIFSNGNSYVGISSGILLSSGNIQDLPGNTSGSNTYDFGFYGDADLNAIIGATTLDAIGIQFDFRPEGDYINFDYVFGSDEYNEYVGSTYNDVFAFLITSINGSGGGYSSADGYGYNKKNIALIPGTSTPVAINNVNKTTNSSWYRDNETGSISIECDGMTKVLTANCPVKPCSWYRLKLVIADVSDRALDSWVFFKENSLNSPSVSNIATSYSIPGAGSDAVEGCSNAIITFNLASAAPAGGRKVPFSLAGSTATIGSDYTTSPNIVPTYNTLYANKYYITVPAGQSSTTLTIIPTADAPIDDNEIVKATVDISFCSASTLYGEIKIRDNSVPLAASIDNGTTQYACQTGGITLTVTPSGGWPNTGYSYYWNPTGLTAQTINQSPTSAITYYVTVTDACGNEASDFVDILLVNQTGTIGYWYGNSVDATGSWDDCKNWGRGKIPDNAVDVVVPDTLANTCLWPIKLAGGLIFGSTGTTNGKSLLLKSSTTDGGRGAKLTVNNDFTINSGALVRCENTFKTRLLIGGNWTDNGSFDRGQSLVTFFGTTQQKVNYNINKEYSFWDLVIDGTDVLFYYNGTSNRRINANNILINNGKKFSTAKQ